MDPLERLWDQLLSREPEVVRGAFGGLSARERRDVLAHLERMVSEEGWHPEQQRSAQAALDALKDETNGNLPGGNTGL